MFFIKSKVFVEGINDLHPQEILQIFLADFQMYHSYRENKILLISYKWVILTNTSDSIRENTLYNISNV